MYHLIDDVLTTPGIITIIAKHLSVNDILSLFLIFKNYRFRDELEACESMINKRKIFYNMLVYVDEQIENIMAMKNHLINDSGYFTHDNLPSYMYKNKVSNGLLNIIDHYPMFFECDFMIRKYYEAFPTAFKHALIMYKKLFKEHKYQERRSNINHAMSITIVKTKKDVLSYPI
jgi:hypothetical protein